MIQEQNPISEQHVITDRESAEAFFHRFVDEHAYVLRAIGSYLEREELSGQGEELLEIEKAVAESSAGQLSCLWSELDTIDLENWKVHPSHIWFNVITLDRLKQTPDSFLRGYSVLIRHPLAFLELLILDLTPSRENFLQHAPSEMKTKLAEYFGRRRRGSAIIEHPPTMYVGILSETGNLQYRIENVSETQLIHPLPWFYPR